MGDASALTSTVCALAGIFPTERALATSFVRTGSECLGVHFLSRTARAPKDTIYPPENSVSAEVAKHRYQGKSMGGANNQAMATGF